MTQSQDAMREAARIIRDLKDSVERLEQERRKEGTLSILLNVRENASIASGADSRRADQRATETVTTADSNQISRVNTGAEFVADSSTADGPDLTG